MAKKSGINVGPASPSPKFKKYMDDSDTLYNRWQNKEFGDREYYEKKRNLINDYKTIGRRPPNFAFKNFD